MGWNRVDQMGLVYMPNTTDDNVNLIKGRVITWNKIKNKQDTNQNLNNKVWKRIHRLEGKQDD